MKFIRQCVWIFGLTMVGELLNYFLPLPIPAGVYGLFLLLICLVTGIVKLEDIEATGNFLLDTMSMMFIPAVVSLINNYTTLLDVLAPYLIIGIPVTAVVMGVTGLTAEFLIRRTSGKEKAS